MASPVAIEILTIGTELLLGTTIDTNGAWLGARLSEAGFQLIRRSTVPDQASALGDALRAALGRTGLVICTGGLGPTPDDLTRDVVAAEYGRELRPDEAWLAVIEARFRERGWRMPAINRVQADVPVGAQLLPNERGTAPGLIVEDAALGTTILLPGVPGEMRWLFEAHVLPYLQRRFPDLRPILSRTIRTTGISESAIAERLQGVEPQIAPLTLAWLPTGIGEDVRVTCWGDLEDAAGALEAAEREIRARLQPYVYASGARDLAEVVGHALAQRGLRLGLAESCTGGLIGQRITAVPGSSRYFVGGYVTYADVAKQRLLGVPAETLQRAGAVSEETARAMAIGARHALEADCAISVTGIAGPDGGTVEKPVGTVWIAVAVGEDVRARSYRFGGDRNEIRARAAQAALALLLRTLDENQSLAQGGR